MRTNLDRWLSNRTMRHEVRCVHLPHLLPACVGKPVSLRNHPQGWLWMVPCPNDRALEVMVAALKLSRRGYTVDTVHRKDWWARLLNPRGRSLTYDLIWGGIQVGCLGWGVLALAGKLGLL